MCKSYKVSVPGSLMLFGEHAVLHGQKAIVAAINYYMHVELIPRDDFAIQIISDQLGEYVTCLENFAIRKPYDYVLIAIEKYLDEINSGFTLKINADFPPNIGFGSSAAVTVATIKVLAMWLGYEITDLLQLHKKAMEVVLAVQGVGSGADVAASIFGGVIVYEMNFGVVEKLNTHLPLVAVYSGSKTKTVDVIAKVKENAAFSPEIFADLYKMIGECVSAAILSIKKNDLVCLGKLMNVHQGLQDALGVNNAILAELIFALRNNSNIYGAKISGSGLGDCVIGLGEIAANFFPGNDRQRDRGVRQIKIEVSDEA